MGTAVSNDWIFSCSCRVNIYANLISYFRRFVDYVKSYKFNKSESLHISFYSERSLEDEVNRESQANTSIVIMSYVVMFLYITLVLGRFHFLYQFFVSFDRNSRKFNTKQAENCWKWQKTVRISTHVMALDSSLNNHLTFSPSPFPMLERHPQ